MPAPTPRDPDAPPIVLDTPFSSAAVRCPCGAEAVFMSDPPLCPECEFSEPFPAEARDAP